MPQVLVEMERKFQNLEEVLQVGIPRVVYQK